MNIKNCRTIQLPKISDSRGNLTYIENSNHIPFDIKRIYYLYNISHNAQRGAHGHIKLQQLLIATSGSFDIILDDAINKKTFHLNSPHVGLYISNGIWRDMLNFSSDAVCLVLASEPYDKNDYIHDHKEFVKFIKK